MQLELPRYGIDFGLKTKEDGTNVLVFNIYGELIDQAMQQIIQEVYNAFDRHTIAHFLINFFHTIDVKGPEMAQLTALRNKARLRGGDIRLIVPKTEIRQVLESLKLVNLDNNQGVFLWFDNLRAALDSFS